MLLNRESSGLPIPCGLSLFLSAFINLSVSFSLPLLFPAAFGQLLTSFALGILISALMLTITKLFSHCLRMETAVFLAGLASLGYGALAFSRGNLIVLNSWVFILGAVAISLEVFGRLFYGRLYQSQDELLQTASASAGICKSVGAVVGYLLPGLFLTYWPNYTWLVCFSVNAISMALSIGVYYRSR